MRTDRRAENRRIFQQGPALFRAPIAALCLLTLTACASRTTTEEREPANGGRLAIRQTGESCHLNLDGDTEPDTVEISLVQGKRTVTIALSLDGSHPHVEELSARQYVECVSNQEPGVPVRGTDETEKAVSVPIMHDYLRFEKAQSSAKLMYFDGSSKTYRAIYQAD